MERWVGRAGLSDWKGTGKDVVWRLAAWCVCGEAQTNVQLCLHLDQRRNSIFEKFIITDSHTQATSTHHRIGTHCLERRIISKYVRG